MIYRDKDGNISILTGKTIAMIGYGNQGRSQALNMRDEGLRVIVGNIDDEYKQRAKSEGFSTFSISEAVKKAEIIFFLIPDEIMNAVFEEKILPNISENNALVFASGYNIAFDLIKAPSNIDVLLIAPRMIGIGVRETYLSREGFFSFVGVHQDASGKAKEILLALSKAVGTLIKGGIEITFMQEAVLDLFTEQGFGPALSSVMTKSASILKEHDYPEEALIIELILSGKMKYNYDRLADFGLTGFFNHLNEKSQYGILSRGIRYANIIRRTIKIQEGILNNIENGSFAEEWEKKRSKFKLKVIKFFASKVGIGKMEKSVRKKVGVPEVDLLAETPYPTSEDIKRAQIIEKELEDFNNYLEF